MPDLGRLAARILALRAGSGAPRVLVGVAGAPGSGKTTLAQALARRLIGADDWRGTAVACVPLDGFHLADRELDRLGRLDRKGAPDTFDAGGYAALLARIRAGDEVWAPDFARELEQPLAQSLPVTSATRIVIGEGNYLLLPDSAWRAVRAQFDEVWFCRVDDEVRRARLLERHVRFGRSPAGAQAWIDRVDEPDAALVAPTERHADLVVRI